MNIASGNLNGRHTPRGIGVTRTVKCRMHAVFSPTLSGLGDRTLQIPNPPRLPLQTRHAMCVKYFSTLDPAGRFYIVERQTTSAAAVARGYPIRGVAGPETRRQRRVKQICLPITGRILVYSGFGVAVESGSSLELG